MMSVTAIGENRLSLALVVLVVCLWLSGCTKHIEIETPEEIPAAKTVFFNSFESTRDTLSWYWASGCNLTPDVPPGGGTISMRVKGEEGQLLPAASFITRPLSRGGRFLLQCWGKVEDIGGFIQLATVSNYEIRETVEAHILDPEWHFVRSNDTLYCPPNSSLMLTMQAGTAVNGSMLVDMIQIKKIYN